MKRKLIITLLCTICFCSCKSLTKTVEVPVYIHDTTQTVRVQHDSTFIDRWHTVEVKGDTVYVTEQQIVSKWRTITDTAYKYIEKPVTVEVEQIKEVAKPLPWWQKSLMWMGAGAIVFFAGVAVLKCKR